MFNHNRKFAHSFLEVRKLLYIVWSVILIFSIGVFQGFAHPQKEEDFKKLWEDPALNEKIDKSIETFRKGDAVIKVVSEDGKPLSGAEIQVKQATHEFLFGCNLFFLKGFKTEQQNKKYESAFLKLFNFATLPFYWSDLEPEQGNVRFSKNSEFISRRPPPDLCVEWGLEHNITLKGHPLIWHAWYPEWLPEDQAKVTRLISDRFAQIAQRYAKSIKIWDVVNEALVRPVNRILPEDYVHWSFQEADKRFRYDNIMMINEVTSVSHKYRREDSHYYLQIMNLKLRGIRIDGIGFQFHAWKPVYEEFVSGKTLTPKQLIDVYTLYSKFDKPLYITEITIPTIGEGSEGQSMQAYIVRNLYRLWFSIPKMAGITWWNLGDVTAVQRENKHKGGLLDEQLEPKASYNALNLLINQEWMTKVNGKISDNGIFSFRGFYGKYNVIVQYEKIKKEFEINVSKEKDIYHTLVLKK